MTSKLLLDNIDTFIGIAKGRKWLVEGFDTGPSNCPIMALAHGFEIRLVPEKRWVDFSHSPDKRPKIAVLEGKATGKLRLARFCQKDGGWEMLDESNAWNDDLALFDYYNWVHEDGTVTPFGVEVEG